MVTRLRFALHGPRNNKIFHLVAINNQKRRNAKPLETLAVFSRRKTAEGQTIEWSVSRIKYWLSVGAEPSKAAERLLRQGRILPELESDKSDKSGKSDNSDKIDNSDKSDNSDIK